MRANFTHLSWRLRLSVPWVMKMMFLRSDGGSSSSLRNGTPRSTLTGRSRFASAGVTHFCRKRAKSRGHFSFSDGGTMTTTGRRPASASATLAATARATNVLPMPTSSARMSPGCVCRRRRISAAVTVWRRASSSEMRPSTCRSIPPARWYGWLTLRPPQRRAPRTPATPDGRRGPPAELWTEGP